MKTAEHTNVDRDQLERRIEDDRTVIRESREKRQQQRTLAERTSKKLGTVRQSLRRAYG